MSGHRLLVEAGALVASALVPLDDDESHHLRVRRAAVGESVELLDGAGVTGRGDLARQGKGWQVTVQEVTHHPAPRPCILAVGAGDRERFLWLAEKCTELGVTRLIPLITERSSQVETRLRESGVARCRKRAREACKQSGNPWATEVAALTHLDALAAEYPGVQWLLADRDGGAMPARTDGTVLGWLIGPEGGFAGEEIDLLRGKIGARPVRLGEHVMRFETAAIVASSML